MKKVSLLLGLALLLGFNGIAQKNFSTVKGKMPVNHSNEKTIKQKNQRSSLGTAAGVTPVNANVAKKTIPIVPGQNLKGTKTPAKVYCYVAYDPTGVLPTGPATFSLSNPGVITSLADQSSMQFVSGGTWGGANKWFGSVYSDNTLITLDTVTGARTVLGNMGLEIDGLSYDYSTKTLYGVGYDGSMYSSLYRIDTATAAPTLIGQCGTDLLINLACDAFGNLYTVGITNDLLYKVNKTTGALTTIGPIGFDASYAQDMEFDRSTSILYMTAYNATSGSGELRTVNLFTGATTLIGAFAGSSEITGFAIPYRGFLPDKDASVLAINSPSNAGTCVLTATELVTVVIANYGIDTLHSVPVSYQINGGTPVTETANVLIVPGANVNYTFTTTVDLSAVGNYTIKAYTSLPGDSNAANDSTSVLVYTTDATLTINIQTDNYGSETTWQITNAATGAVVDSGGPFPDITGGGYYSTAVCASSTECYNFTINDAGGNGICCVYGSGTYEVQWNGLSLGVIPGSFGSSASINNICAPKPYDAGVSAIIAPSNASSCTLTSSEVVTVAITNHGTNTIDSIPVSYQINGGTPVTDTANIVIASGATVNYTFTSTVDLSAPGTYSIKAYTSLPGDGNAANDTTTVTVVSTDATITVNIQTDSYGNETTWQITDASTGQLVGSGGPYPIITGGAYYSTAVCASSTECYNFTIYDAGGNGICCTYGNGTYEVQWNGFSFGVKSGNFGSSATINNICAPKPFDAGVIAINKPTSGCALSNAEDVQVKIKNFGMNDISNFQVAYTINGGTPVVANISQTLPSSDTMTYIFTGAQAADLSVNGQYNIAAYSILTNDGDNSNDTITTVVNSGPATIPYSMGFEANEDLTGWYMKDNNADGFTWSIYSNSSYAHSGNNYAAYSFNNNGTTPADDWIISKCVQLDSAQTYKISFWYRVMDASLPEKLKLFVGTDTSVSSMTTLIKDYGSLTNMTYIQSINFFTPPTTGIYHFGWDCYSDANMYELMIDDIMIDTLPPHDAGVSAITPPSNGNLCALTATEPVTIAITNAGKDTIFSVPVSYQVNGGTPVTQTANDTIAPGVTVNYTFTGTVDLSAPGSYIIKAYTSLPGDTIATNDTATVTVVSYDATLTVNIQTDNYGNETTWQITDAATGLVVGSGGPYPMLTGGAYYSTTVCAFSTECYNFTIYDSNGNGICCANGNGTYEIKWNSFSFGVIPGSFTYSATINNICAPQPYDAGSYSIDVYNGIASSIAPKATFRNYGADTASFNVTMNISPGGYTSTQTINNLAPGTNQQVTFTPNWNATAGTYNVKIYSSLSNDMNHANDTLTKTVTFANIGKKAYCYVTYDPSYMLPNGPAIVDLNNPNTILSIADQSTQNFVLGATWGGANKWYGSVYTDNSLVTLDTITGARTVIGNMGVEIDGLTYDYSSKTMYGMGYDGMYSSLYSIDTATAATTLIGVCGSDLLIELACDYFGNLYAVGITNDLLYKVNKTTGALTTKGTIGFDASYAQDMEFDRSTSTLYMAAFNNSSYSGELRTVNTATGATTLIGAFSGTSEITGFVIPFYGVMPAKDASVSAIISPSNANSCALSASQVITVAISNFGTDTIHSVPVTYSVNGGAPVTQTANVTIAPGATVNFTFPGTVDMSAQGSYSITAFTSLPGDVNPVNDSFTGTVISANGTITINIQGDYFSDTDNSWTLINNSTNMIVASGAIGSILPNTLNTIYVCALSSNCYTFTIYDAFGDGIDPGGYSILWNGTLLYSNYAFYGYSDSYSSICMPLTDAGVTMVKTPVTKCALTNAENVAVEIKNFGNTAISNFKVAYTINGGLPVIALISQSIPGGDSVAYTFTGAQAANLSTYGQYTFKVYTMVTGDMNHANDTITKVVRSGPATIPFSMGFEPNEDFGGWTTIDNNADAFTWEIYNNSANAHTGNNSAAYFYNSNGTTPADDWLISTCINFDAGKTYQVSFWYKVLDLTLPEKLKLFLGTDTTVASMTTLIQDYGSLANDTYLQSINSFTVPTTGVYRLGWYCYSNPSMWAILIDDINIDVSVGINNTGSAFAVNVYPNPAKDILNVSASENISNIRLLDVFGQLVMTRDVNEKFTSINTSTLAEGMYFLQLQTKNEVTTKNIIIQK